MDDSTTRKSDSRIVGFYLLFLGAIVSLTGIVCGVIARLFYPMRFAGAGPSDPNEPLQWLYSAYLFAAIVTAIGIVIGLFGFYLMAKSRLSTADTIG